MSNIFFIKVIAVNIKETGLDPISVFVLTCFATEKENSKSFFKDLVNFTISGPVVAMILNGDVQVARKLVGQTLPWKAEEGTIRGDFACCMRENLVHCSDSIESSKREIGSWFR